MTRTRQGEVNTFEVVKRQKSLFYKSNYWLEIGFFFFFLICLKYNILIIGWDNKTTTM